MSPAEALESIYACCGCSGANGAGEVLEALLRRDWAVRVLDAWALINRNWPGPETVKCDYRRRGEWGCMVGFEDLRTSTRRKAYYGDSPDAARLAAAEAVWPELPESVRAELGERP